MNELIDKLREEFKDKETRRIYVDDFLNTYIATQIKVLREQRELTQDQLAGLANMRQERISVLEDVDYSSWTINVLRRLAEAFDLRLSVKFESFGSFLNEFETFGRSALERPSFEDDPVFADEALAAAFGAVRYATYTTVLPGIPLTGLMRGSTYYAPFSVSHYRDLKGNLGVIEVRNRFVDRQTCLDNWRPIHVGAHVDVEQPALFAHPDLNFENALTIGNLGSFKEGTSTNAFPAELLTEQVQ
jgi:transcriptional regulator with XRE-family HTH domain